MKEVLRKETKVIIIFIFSSLVAGLVDVSFASIIQIFIDSLETSNSYLFKRAILLFIIFLFSNFIFNRFVIWIQSLLTKNIHIRLKSNLTKYFLSLNYGDFTQTTTGEKMNDFEYKLVMIEQYYLDNLWEIIQAFLLLIVSTTYLFFINPLICLIVFILGLISMLVPLCLGDKLNNLVSTNTKVAGEYLHFLKEMFQGMIVIKSFQKEKNFFKQFENKLLDFEKSTQLLNNKNGMYNQISGLFQYLIIISCLCFGGILVLNNNLSLSKMIAITQVSNLIVGPIQQIGSAVIDIIASKQVRNELSEIVSTNYSLYNKRKTSIDFDNFTISTNEIKVNDKKILGKIEFQFENNKKYCIVGANGSGKSSLGRLILGLVKNTDTSKEILLNGKKSSFEEIASLIAYIPQTSIAFRASLEENITLFDNYSKGEIDAVIRFVNLDNRINDIKNISENGENISGGELKKITIARAMIEDSPIILLDEFESALDEISCNLITDKLLQTEKCIICISHNLDKSFLSRFDSIIFMENGEILQSGELRELSKSCIEFNRYISEFNEV